MERKWGKQSPYSHTGGAHNKLTTLKVSAGTLSLQKCEEANFYCFFKQTVVLSYEQLRNIMVVHKWKSCGEQVYITVSVL